MALLSVSYVFRAILILMLLFSSTPAHRDEIIDTTADFPGEDEK